MASESVVPTGYTGAQVFRDGRRARGEIPVACLEAAVAKAVRVGRALGSHQAPGFIEVGGGRRKDVGLFDDVQTAAPSEGRDARASAVGRFVLGNPRTKLLLAPASRRAWLAATKFGDRTNTSGVPRSWHSRVCWLCSRSGIPLFGSRRNGRRDVWRNGRSHTRGSQWSRRNDG